MPLSGIECSNYVDEIFLDPGGCLYVAFYFSGLYAFGVGIANEVNELSVTFNRECPSRGFLQGAEKSCSVKHIHCFALI